LSASTKISDDDLALVLADVDLGRRRGFAAP
jgi:hypothetical protein